MAKDKYHHIVVNALIKEGWTITHDPLRIPIDNRGRNIQIDLGAEKILIGAQKGTQKIAIEIKSFIGTSELHDFYKALGQYLFYKSALDEFEPSRILYLAVPKITYERFFTEKIVEKTIKSNALKIVVYDIDENIIDLWIK